MQTRFVIEAVMLAIYGHLLLPDKPVEYIIPSSTVGELHEIANSEDPVMPDPEDDRHAKESIRELIKFFEQPFYAKRIRNSLVAPWRKSPALPIHENVSLTVIYATESAQYGEKFDPVETELMLTAIHEKAPLLTDQVDMIERMLEAGVPVLIVDIDDFEYALDEGIERYYSDL
ncbi:ADP-heptose synthase [Paenibacillus swuensis]|uniref:ADP-heptose synthase n=1 Tax=Paenibacillus swuensis TaxID=1178515 RepID=A0A172TIY9_9BACL|nr:ADP-heptose synthase [Paenibacillus swuensis]ANE46926.1 ADP-heptose synthase [Paenibacillus swuensis]